VIRNENTAHSAGSGTSDPLGDEVVELLKHCLSCAIYNIFRGKYTNCPSSVQAKIHRDNNVAKRYACEFSAEADVVRG
jgi:hypothetical protein